MAVRSATLEVRTAASGPWPPASSRIGSHLNAAYGEDAGEISCGGLGELQSHTGLARVGAGREVDVGLVFEWPGRLSLRKAIANQDVALASLGLERFRQALGERARELALSMAGATEKARVAREVADRFRALREVLVQRDPAGITPQLEIRILEATELGLRRRAVERELEAGA